MKHNKIVIDHNADTTIAKDSGFDLLNEKSTLPRKIITPTCSFLNKECLSIPTNHCLLLQELNNHCNEHRNFLKSHNFFEPISHPNYISSIKNTIECLASKQELLSLEQNMKSEFHKIFSPIPHIDLLPPHEPARIHLKDAYKKF